MNSHRDAFLFFCSAKNRVLGVSARRVKTAARETGVEIMTFPANAGLQNNGKGIVVYHLPQGHAATPNHVPWE
jgi:hypothetical protein